MEEPGIGPELSACKAVVQPTITTPPQYIVPHVSISFINHTEKYDK